MSEDLPSAASAKATSSSKLQWSEPLFFRLLSYGQKSWAIRLVVVLTLYTSLVRTNVATHSQTPPEGATTVDRLSAIAMSVGLVALFELSLIKRLIVVTPYGIECRGFLPLIGWSHWNRSEIRSIAILHPRQGPNKHSCNALLVTLKHAESKWIGVPDSQTLDKIAEKLGELGVTVEFDSSDRTNEQGSK